MEAHCPKEEAGRQEGRDGCQRAAHVVEGGEGRDDAWEEGRDRVADAAAVVVVVGVAGTAGPEEGRGEGVAVDCSDCPWIWGEDDSDLFACAS